MATQDNDQTRRIVGAVIQSGKIYRAGDEDALFAVVPETDRHRMVAAGHLTGDWSGAAPSSPDTETDSDEEEGLPPLAEMADHLAGIETADEVKALRKTDKRKGAKALYEARLQELAVAEQE